MTTTTELPKNWLFTISLNRYMDKELFSTWFKKIFIPYADQERPIILVLDNHDSHISYDLLQTAKDHQVSKLHNSLVNFDNKN